MRSEYTQEDHICSWKVCVLLDECRALWGEPEQAVSVCQGLKLCIRSSYTRVPFRTSCRGVEVGVAFSKK